MYVATPACVCKCMCVRSKYVHDQIHVRTYIGMYVDNKLFQSDYIMAKQIIILVLYFNGFCKYAKLYPRILDTRQLGSIQMHNLFSMT